MSLLCCCASRRRAGDDTPDAEGQECPSPMARPESSRASVITAPTPRECPMMDPVLPEDDPIELSQLIVDDSDGEAEADTSVAKTTSTLGNVRTKLIRHMSQETDEGQRRGSSVGHSEEEVARRAELRRFRHQRIQDELKDAEKHETSNEDSSQTSHRSTQYLSALIDVGLPGGGPRDNFLFGFDNRPSPSMTPHSVGSSHSSKEKLEEQAGDISLQLSSHAQIGEDVGALMKEAAEEDTEKKVRDLSPSKAGCPQEDIPKEDSPQEDSQLQLQPHAQAQAPSIHSSPSQKSLGCSYPSARLDRVLGPNSEFDPLRSSQTTDDQSALGIWLIAQSLRTRSNSTGLSSEHKKAESAGLEQAPTAIADLGGIDGVEDLPQAPLEQALDSPPDAVKPRPKDGTSKKTESSKDSSSTYPSVLPSFSPSPDRAQSNAPHLTARDIESLQLEPFHWQGHLGDPRASEARSSYFTAEDNHSCSDVNATEVRLARIPQAMPIDPASTSFSETESFRQRESELQTMEKRFGEVMSRKRPNPIASSRFREEFQDASSGSRRVSFKMKMGLTVTKRSKNRSASNGSNSISGLLSDLRGTAAKKTVQQRSLSGTQNKANKLRKPAPRSISHPLGRTADLISKATSRAVSREKDERPQFYEPIPIEKGSSATALAAEIAVTDSRGPSQEVKRPSGAWARFPSHGRSERGRYVSAQEVCRFGTSDLVDFVSGGQERGADAAKNTKTAPSAEMPRSLPEKLARGVRLGFSKLLYSKAESGADTTRPRREPDDSQSLGQDSPSGEEVLLAGQNPEHDGFDGSNSARGGDSSQSVDELFHDSEQLAAPPAVHTSDSHVTVGTVRSVLASDQIRQVESGVVGEVFHTPVSPLAHLGDGEMSMEPSLLAPGLHQTQKMLRRWRSNVDGPAEGPPSMWSGPVMAQSLSMNNLRASSDEEEYDSGDESG